MTERRPQSEAPELRRFPGDWSTHFVARSGEPFVEPQQLVQVVAEDGETLRVTLRLRYGRPVELPGKIGWDACGKPRLEAGDDDLRFEAEHFLAKDFQGRAQVMLCGMVLRRHGGSEDDDTESFTAVNEGDPPGARTAGR